MWASKSKLELLTFCCWPLFASGHVQFAFPTSRIDSDYQYTLDGSCERESCDSFCGERGEDRVLTPVSPGPLVVTIDVNILHPPFKYRISLSTGDDSGFDSNILLDDIPNPNPNPGRRGSGGSTFDVTVDIPNVACQPICTLHLYDYYYFVSCADILISGGGAQGTSSTIAAREDTSQNSLTTNLRTSTEAPPRAVANAPVANAQVANAQAANAPVANKRVTDAPVSDVTAPQRDEGPTMEQQDQGSNVIITAQVTLPTITWLSLGFAPEGGMLNARAIIGNIGGRLRTSEYDLNGRSPGSFVRGERAAKSSYFDVTEENGQYVHMLSATVPKEDSVLGNICGWPVIWAHGDSTELSYHGRNRGVLGNVECKQPSTSSTTSTIAAVTVAADLGICADHPEGWHDSGGEEYNCERYAEANCPDGSSYRNFGFTAQEACCACGGGKREGEQLPLRGQVNFSSAGFEVKNCKDHPEGWYDSGGEDFDCARYAQHGCPDGSLYRNFGFTAQEACCACGGGTTVTGQVQGSSSLQSPTKSGNPTIVQKDQGEVLVMIAEVTLPTESWFSLGFSPDGSMLGSRAVIGNVGGDPSASEYDLTSMFTAGIIPVSARLAAQNPSFQMMRVGSGYLHRLTVTINKGDTSLGDICSMTLIWAHSDPSFPSKELGYHGNSRGEFGKVQCSSE